MTPERIPAAMVEAAAHAVHLLDAPIGEDYADRQGHWERTAKAVLAAALGVCEVEEQWGRRSHWSDGTDHDGWHLDRHGAEHAVSQATNIPRSLIRRLVITSPAERVMEAEGTDD